MQQDIIWAVIAFTLTLLVFSYLFGDNFLFRFVAYLFVGVTAGYMAVLMIYQVLLPRIIYPLRGGSTPEILLAVVPLVLGLLLFGKLVPRLSFLGNVPAGFLVGVGAATLVGGALLGTLGGQIQSAANGFDLRTAAQTGRSPVALLLESGVLLLGTISTLVYFQFSVRTKNGQAAGRPPVVERIAGIGKAFIAFTLGALFAGVFAAAVTALIDRLDFLTEFIFNFLT